MVDKNRCLNKCVLNDNQYLYIAQPTHPVIFWILNDQWSLLAEFLCDNSCLSKLNILFKVVPVWKILKHNKWGFD